MTSAHYHDCFGKGDYLNRMDNPGYVRDAEAPSTVELGNIQAGSTSVDTGKSINGNGVVGCSDACLSLHKKYELLQGKQSAPESPWHRLKSIFLIGTIVLLIVWIIIYVIASLTSG